MISRSSMGKQLTGNRTKKMAKGGSASASKNTAAKGAATPVKKTGGSAAGKTINTSSVKPASRDGGGGMFSGVTNVVRGVKNAFSGNSKFSTVTDPKTGMSYAKPSYGALSWQGLTSKDPANVARNRAAAAKYAAMDAARLANRSDREGQTQGGMSVTSQTPAETTPAAAPKPTMVYVPAPAGYRPGIDPEHRFYQPAPAAMKRGGKVKPKGKK